MSAEKPDQNLDAEKERMKRATTVFKTTVETLYKQWREKDNLGDASYQEPGTEIDLFVSPMSDSEKVAPDSPIVAADVTGFSKKKNIFTTRTFTLRADGIVETYEYDETPDQHVHAEHIRHGFKDFSPAEDTEESDVENPPTISQIDNFLKRAMNSESSEIIGDKATAVQLESFTDFLKAYLSDSES